MSLHAGTIARSEDSVAEMETPTSQTGTSLGPRGRILLAAYHFPPSAAVGGLRMARFAKFLPEFGWSPYVLTVLDEDRDLEQGTDITRLTGLERVPIRRTHSRAGRISALYRMLKSRLRGSETRRNADLAAPKYTNHRAVDESLLSRFKRYIGSIFLMLPDEQKGWAVSSALTAVRLVRSQRIDWILTSGPPFSVHLIGLVVRTFTRTKWVADFRDPWVEMLPERSNHLRSALSDTIERRMEAVVIRRADKVLMTNERARQSVAARYSHMPDSKFVCLPNGIDLRQAVRREAPDRHAPLTITYAGTLYFERTPEPLFQAFSELVQEGRARLTDFRIKLVGNCDYIRGMRTHELARRFGIEEAVEVLRWLPRAEAVSLMQRSHLLLVLAPPNHRLMLPAKLFDYVGSGTPVLAIAEPGPTTDFVRETKCGQCFAQTEMRELKEYLHDLLQTGGYSDLRYDLDAFARYDARSLSGQLASVLSGQMQTNQ